MRIINVIEMLNGNISQILSYPINEDKLSEQIIESAEDTFKKILIEVRGFEEEDCEEFVESGYYCDDNGWEVYLTWSTEVL